MFYKPVVLQERVPDNVEGLFLKKGVASQINSQ